MLFFSIYLGSIAYGMLPGMFKETKELPQSAYTEQVTNMTTNGMASAQTTVFASFGLIAVAVIILAAYGSISVFGGY